MAIPNSHSRVDVNPCSFLAFKTIGEDSAGFGCVVGSTATDSGLDRIGLGDVVSRGMDDGPMPKDHLDIECFEYLIKGFSSL